MCGGNRRASQKLSTLVALVMLLAPVRCSETWSWKSEHSAFVIGGKVLRVAGIGFQSGTDYYCRFKTVDSHRSVWSFADIVRPHDVDVLGQTPPQPLMSIRGRDRLESEDREDGKHLRYAEMPDGGVQCVVPHWPVHAQNVTFSIGTSPLGIAIPLAGEARESMFSYLAGWDAVDSNSPRIGEASGGTQLRIRAAGLDTLSNQAYSCKFVFSQSANEQKSLSSTAAVVNQTLLTCLTPAWGSKYAATNVALSIYRGEEELHNFQAGAAVSCDKHKCGGFSFQYYAVWEVTDEGPHRSSVYGASNLTLSGFGFHADNLTRNSNKYLCVFTSQHHTASSVATVLAPWAINCMTPAWPRGNQIVNLSLFSTSGTGNASSFSVPAVGERQTGKILYSAGWHSKSLNQSLADGGQSVTLTGLGFKPLHSHQDYTFTCRFSSADRGSDENAHTDTSAISSDHTWIDAPALVLSDSQVACTVPRWMRAAAYVQLLLRQCVHTICSAVPQKQGVEIFEYKEVWGRLSLKDGGSQGSGSVTGGDLLFVGGLAFKTDGHYVCTFTRDSLQVQNMQTGAVVLNETLLMCLTPPWVEKFVAQTVRFQLHANDSDAEAAVAYVQLAFNGSNQASAQGQCDDVGCLFTFLAKWQSTTMPNRSSVNSRTVLLAKGQETIMIHGVGFPPGFASNCTFYAPSGQLLDECATKAQVLSSTLLICVTALCVPTDSNATLLLTGSYASIPETIDVMLESSWSGLAFTGSPLEMVVGNASVRILGVGFGVGARTFQCDFYGNNTFIASTRAAKNFSDGRACVNGSCDSHYLTCTVPTWPVSVSQVTLRVVRLIQSRVEQGTISIAFTGESGADALVATEFWTRVEPTEVDARGVAVLTVHGVALPASSTLLCIFQRAGAGTLVTGGLSVSAGVLLCPTPEWGRWNAAGRAAGVVWLNVSNDDRFAAVDANRDQGISFDEFKAASRVLAHDDLDAVLLARLFQGIDINGDMRISLTEFWLWMPKKPSISHSSTWGDDLRASILFHTTLDSAAVNSAPSLVLPTGGQQVLISGSGFDKMAQYTCVFSDDVSDDHKALSEARVVNTTHIACPTVLWSWPMTTAGTLEILQNASAVGVFNDTSTAKLPLSIQDAVVRIEPTKATAAGGVTVTVHGYGFDVTVSQHYRCLFDGVRSQPVTVDSTFLILCVVPKWENSSRAVSFQLERAGRIIDRVSVKGVLQYFLAPEPLSFAFSPEALSIFPAFADRIGGTDGGARNSPAITVMGAGFSLAHTYRCQLHQGARMLQSFVARPTSPSVVQCVPPQWDMVTGSHAFVSQHVNVTLLASDETGWTSAPVFAHQSFPLTLLQINKAPSYTVKTRSGLNWWVVPRLINISEPVGDQPREFSFQWASDIMAGSTYLGGMDLACACGSLNRLCMKLVPSAILVL